LFVLTWISYFYHQLIHLVGVTVAPTCNSTQSRQIISGLSDAAELSSVARSYLLETGNFSPIFTKYFGANASSAAVIGVYDRILWANKEGVLFRCDDVDGKWYTPSLSGWFDLLTLIARRTPPGLATTAPRPHWKL
jgi:hypothetical protein